jgi:hypothetical protein
VLAEGKLMKAGSVLHMTTRTVAYHKYRIMEVLGAIKTLPNQSSTPVRNDMVAAFNWEIFAS